MIFVTGYGQMCNNMLQFGHFYAFGKKHAVSTIGMRFCYKYRFFKISNKSGYNWFTYLTAKYMAKFRLIKSVDFSGDYSDEEVALLKTSKNILAKGWYFRDYDGFLEYQDEIRELFAFKNLIENRVNSYLSSLPNTDIRIGIHVRRGDYKNWHNGAYYYSDEEYCNIISQIVSQLENRAMQLIIVSNDPKINTQTYTSLTGKEAFSLNGNPAEDLALLSKCDYIIGPPSTFSLMAAFYDNKPLYWIFDKNKKTEISDFKEFSDLFKHII